MGIGEHAEGEGHERKEQDSEPSGATSIIA